MKYRKFAIKHQNNVPILDVARFYLSQIKTSNIKILNFYPLSKSSLATPNMFRLAVLKHLTHNSCYQAHNNKRELEIATEAAISAGYIINEVPLSDYDRKLYLNDIKNEAEQFTFLQAA